MKINSCKKALDNLETMFGKRPVGDGVYLPWMVEIQHKGIARLDIYSIQYMRGSCGPQQAGSRNYMGINDVDEKMDDYIVTIQVIFDKQKWEKTHGGSVHLSLYFSPYQEDYKTEYWTGYGEKKNMAEYATKDVVAAFLSAVTQACVNWMV